MYLSDTYAVKPVFQPSAGRAKGVVRLEKQGDFSCKCHQNILTIAAKNDSIEMYKCLLF